MQRTCHNTWCNHAFTITDADLAFYDAVSPVIRGVKFPIPIPNLCPSCRYQERLTWRNERNLYRRTCSATGESIISIWSPEKSSPPVYKQSYWWSDAWDARSYGQEIDWNRPFFEQWSELFSRVPQIAMNNQESENAEYTNQSQRNKDSYMLFCSDLSRDCYHGMWNSSCTNCTDCSYIEHCELCYEILNGKNCYSCRSCENIEDCSTCFFCHNCIGCKNCYGCINLRNKEYHFFNEPCAPQTYAERLRELHLERRSGVEHARAETEKFFSSFPRKYYKGTHILESTGDYLRDTSETHDSYNCRNTEHLNHCQDVWRADHCQDMTEMINNRFCYSLEGCADSERTLFSAKFDGLYDSSYCSHCHFSHFLFGCIGLKHASYCILNKQYSQEEYERLVPQVIEHMRHTSEWGRHIPSHLSPYGYNETVANEYFPLTRAEALARGFHWRDAVDEPPQASAVIRGEDLPDSIDALQDDATTWAIECQTTRRPFKIIAQELAFYRANHIPLPFLHPDERYRRRMARRNPRKLWKRSCGKCGKEMETTYAPERLKIVYCEECYLREVY